MDQREAQLHQEIIHTRQAIDERLAQLEDRIQRTVHGAISTAHDIINHGLGTTTQGMQETGDRGVAVVARYPWLTIVGGMLLGYLLGCTGKARRLPAESRRVRAYEVGHQWPPVTRP